MCTHISPLFFLKTFFLVHLSYGSLAGVWVENALDSLFPYIYYQHHRGHLQEFNVIDW